MKYYLKNNVHYVKGKYNSALYDLSSGKIYLQNEDATKILDFILSNDVISEEIERIPFIQKLIDFNLISPEHHNEQIMPEIPPRIRYVWLELTNKCNFNCIHCYGSFGHPSIDNLKKELKLEQWKQILDKIKTAGGDAIQLIGGEPLLFKDFIPLMKYIRELNFKVVDIFTNGYLLSDDILDIVEETGANLRVSLYGPRSDIHDAITQRPGSFSDLDKMLDEIKKRKIHLTIAVVLMKENQDYLEDIKEYIESKGFEFKGYDAIRTVSGTDLHEHRVTRIDRLKYRYICEPSFFINESNYILNKQWNSCWFGKFSVTATGEVIPCIFARDCVCGNILTDNEEEIKTNLMKYWKITKDQVEGCKDCEYRYACSDCRPLSKSINDDLYAKFPRCCYDVENKKWVDIGALKI